MPRPESGAGRTIAETRQDGWVSSPRSSCGIGIPLTTKNELPLEQVTMPAYAQALLTMHYSIIHSSLFIIFSFSNLSLPPTHPPPHHLIHTSDPLPTGLNLKPFPMFPPTNTTFPAPLCSLPIQLNMYQSLYFMSVWNLPWRSLCLVHI